jgi:hypothetical protein
MTFFGPGGLPGPGAFGCGTSVAYAFSMAVVYGECSSLVIGMSVRPPVRRLTSSTTDRQFSAVRLPGTRVGRRRLSGSTAVWSQSSPRSRSSGSPGSHFFSFFPTKPHFPGALVRRTWSRAR